MMQIPVLFFAVVGFLCCVSAAVKVWRARPKKSHALARRPPPSMGRLLDEVPDVCPVCGTAAVILARGDYVVGAHKLQNTEHFRCANGDRFLGPNQAEWTKSRLEARRKLRAVVDPKEYMTPPSE